MLSERRIAIVHPWVVDLRGGEKTFFAIARALPHADLFLLHYRPEGLPPDIRSRVAGVSFLQRAPFRHLPYRAMLPLLPMAAESLDLSAYDLVLSSSYGWSHGVLARDGAQHICYMYSPPRYLWSRDEQPTVAGLRAGALAAPLLHYARIWDVAAAQRVDAFIAISRFVARRINQRYRRPAQVVYPPVDVSRFAGGEVGDGGYVFAMGALVPYKRFDLVIQACRLARQRLVIVGDGPERRRLQELARGADVTFLGRVSDAEARRALMGASLFIHPGIEDFGIATVEALAAGVPVVGAAQSGTAEIVDEQTGVLVLQQNARSYAEALCQARVRHFDRAALQARAAEFGPDRFQNRLLAALERSLTELGATDDAGTEGAVRL